ncbi:MAG: RNA-binding S4 domain-containing protein [Bacteroidota bacterium]
MEKGIRIDKWLWATRIFKTRNLAAEACRSGKVKILGQVIKPSREINAGDVITLAFPPIIKTVKVVELTANRVSAKLVPELMQDLTPEEEYQKLKRNIQGNFEFRERGIGRPTKRKRREIEYLKLYLGE